ncbi:hypothetical protein BD310DRAFT_921302 [Dichomitus squalens]|uniref:Uncharacterized protein n=1 Tax=Dichomitus squalens TaxID=114155 RepID=A0A4Q9Q2L2_9APHY|nr:hypothetical protein BD310DRAFT_921302 [Dichomitus squalens]
MRRSPSCLATAYTQTLLFTDASRIPAATRISTSSRQQSSIQLQKRLGSNPPHVSQPHVSQPQPRPTPRDSDMR